MTELEKQIAELREIEKDYANGKPVNSGAMWYALKSAQRIIESLQAENQELKSKLFENSIEHNKDVILLAKEIEKLWSKLEESIKALTKIQNIAHEGFGCGSQVTWQQTAEAHEKCALEALYKINGEK